VQETLKTCARAVDANVFSIADGPNIPVRSLLVQLRSALRLRGVVRSLQSHFARNFHELHWIDALNIVRFQETINGRSYVIEVLPVGPDRWRAQIGRVPGGTTALMPFYGTTAVEAARLLSGWLTRAAGDTER
jgi:hypothetical protein